MVNLAENLLDLGAFGGGEARPTEADRVDSGDEVDVRSDHKGREIEGKPRISLGHDEVSKPDELVEDRAATEETLVPDRDVAGEQDVVRQGVVVADDGIVSDMGPGHEVIPVPEAGFAPLMDAPVHRDVLPEDIAASNGDAGPEIPIKSAELRVGSDDGAGPDETFRPDPTASPDLGGRFDEAAVSDFGPRFDDRKRADGDTDAELRIGRNEGLGMD